MSIQHLGGRKGADIQVVVYGDDAGVRHVCEGVWRARTGLVDILSRGMPLTGRFRPLGLEGCAAPVERCAMRDTPLSGAACHL